MVAFSTLLWLVIALARPYDNSQCDACDRPATWVAQGWGTDESADVVLYLCETHHIKLVEDYRE